MMSFVIGIAGGSGSGKSSISRIIAQEIKTNSVTILNEKGYYRNKSQEPLLEEQEKNFDHPKDFDNDLLLKQLKQLLNGQSINEPFYSFKEHVRLHKTVKKYPAKIIIVEGMLALYDERLRKLMNLKIFVNASQDIMLIRRLRRDMKTKSNLDLDYTFRHYLRTIKPMYQQFVLPTQRYADIIIPQSWKNKIAIDAVVSKINSIVNK